MSAKIIAFPVKEEVGLTEHERDTILVAADEMICVGGRELLVQMLKGMRSEVVLEAGAEKRKNFGALSALTLGEIEAKIDQLVQEDLLRIELYGSRSLLVHSPSGWIRVKSLWSELLWRAFERRLRARDFGGLQAEVGRLHVEVKLSVLERIAREDAARFQPLLSSWRERETRRIRRKIDEVLARIAPAR